MRGSRVVGAAWPGPPVREVGAGVVGGRLVGADGEGAGEVGREPVEAGGAEGRDDAPAPGRCLSIARAAPGQPAGAWPVVISHGDEHGPGRGPGRFRNRAGGSE